jgi:hypothetical protein
MKNTVATLTQSPMKFVLVFVLFFAVSLYAHATDEDEYFSTFYEEQLNAFPATSLPVARQANLKLKGNKKALPYKSELLSNWENADEPNFAGHYFVMEPFICGRACTIIFIADWNTGRIFTTPDPGTGFATVKTKRESRLLIMHPARTCVLGNAEKYVFDGAKFHQIQRDECRKVFGTSSFEHSR